MSPKQKSTGSLQETLYFLDFFISVQFSGSIMLDPMQPHGLQHTRLHCPSPPPGVYSNSCPLSQWCHPMISSSVVSFSLQSCWASGSFPVGQFFTSGGQSVGQFSISHSNEHSGLISFRMDWFDLLAVQGTLRNLLQQLQFKSISSSVLSFIYGPTLTSIHDYWKNHTLTRWTFAG